MRYDVFLFRWRIPSTGVPLARAYRRWSPLKAKAVPPYHLLTEKDWRKPTTNVARCWCVMGNRRQGSASFDDVCYKCIFTTRTRSTAEVASTRAPRRHLSRWRLKVNLTSALRRGSLEAKITEVSKPVGWEGIACPCLAGATPGVGRTGKKWRLLVRRRHRRQGAKARQPSPFSRLLAGL